MFQKSSIYKDRERFITCKCLIGTPPPPPPKKKKKKKKLAMLLMFRVRCKHCNWQHVRASSYYWLKRGSIIPWSMHGWALFWMIWWNSRYDGKYWFGNLVMPRKKRGDMNHCIPFPLCRIKWEKKEEVSWDAWLNWFSSVLRVLYK